MASSKQVLLLSVVAAVACLASLTSATVWTVGEEGGWRAKFNETGWANGKTFVVGDSLLFLYPKENHTVALVGEDDFAACNLQGNLIGTWNSGNDLVTLDKPGKVWFICTVPTHCDKGMKLVVDVVGGDSAPAPSFPAQSSFPFWFWGPAPAPAPPASAPAPAWPQAAPPSGAVRYSVGGAVAAAAAAIVAAVLAL